MSFPLGSLGAKSGVSNTCRISTSVSSKGARLSHSIASSLDFTCHSQNPATSSLVSAKGPSITVRFPFSNFTRAPFELAWSPSPASITPAFTRSSLNFPISASIFSLGRTPASESLLAFTITMNRIVVSPWLAAGLPDDLRPVNPRFYCGDERRSARSTRARMFLGRGEVLENAGTISLPRIDNLQHLEGLPARARSVQREREVIVVGHGRRFTVGDLLACHRIGRAALQGAFLRVGSAFAAHDQRARRHAVDPDDEVLPGHVVES